MIIVSREHGDTVVQLVQTDTGLIPRLSIPLESVVVRGGRATIELPRDNTLADIAHVIIECLDELDGIEADRITSTPDA